MRVTVLAARVRTTVNYFSGRPQPLPVAVAELGLPGARRSGTVSAAVRAACRSDLVTVDGRPVGVRVVGSRADAAARRALSVEPCGPQVGGLVLGPGAHVVRTRRVHNHTIGADVVAKGKRHPVLAAFGILLVIGLFAAWMLFVLSKWPT